MKTFIAMLIMSVGFMLFGQTMTAESVMKDYKIQHDKIVSEFVTKMQTQNNATIKKLETINSESSKEKADVLKNWSIDSIKTDASDIKIPVAPGVVIDRKPLPKDAVEFKGHHYYISTEPMNYADAEEYCKTAGCSIVRIDNRDELNFIKKIINKNKAKDSYWIKGLDVDKDSDLIKLLNIRNPPLDKGLDKSNLISYKSDVFKFGTKSHHYLFICEWDY